MQEAGEREWICLETISKHLDAASVAYVFTLSDNMCVPNVARYQLTSHFTISSTPQFSAKKKKKENKAMRHPPGST